MTKTVTILGFLAVFSAGMAGMAGAGWADDDCFVPMAEWQPRDAVKRLVAENGWTARRIKVDDGCYEIDGTDAEGRPIEVTVHPATLQVIEIDYEDDEDEDRRRRRGREDRDGRDDD